MCTSRIKWKRKRTLDGLQFTMVWYLLWESIHSAKLYQNAPIGSFISRLEVLMYSRLRDQVSDLKHMVLSGNAKVV